MLKNDFVRRLREVFQRFLGLKNKETEAEIKGSFFRPILFLFPNILKESISSDDDINDWQKDYLSKNKNIEKYLFDGCEALQIIGISYSKYKRELARYSDGELNQKTGKIVGRNFEIEARLALRRTLELFVESWHFKEIKSDKEKMLRHFFLVKNLKAFYSRKNNAEKFCDMKLEFDTNVISEIRTELCDLNVQNPFYLANGKDFNKDGEVKDLTKSFYKLFEEAIPQIAAAPHVIVGESYQLYAETSEVIHGYSGGPNFNLQNYHQEILAIYTRAAVLASNILKHLVIIGEGIIKNNDIREAIDGLRTDSLPQNLSLGVGDKVMVLKQVRAEVTEISVSKCGCKKYKVKYDDKRGDWNWSFGREWFLLKDLTKVSD
ncbi:hypothetical protein A2Z53_02445 [Candidatus Giovannonibacteria bacterium RIFCSPHIGHO2_02_42_15]|uniref:Uncharacterized protein n=2 Tax=Candidatus Giovannoniibacteriota TaxID=1752738 RepID=A0A1F5VPQ7_9BACT|nr:MAG: hypothetical protein UV11_C0006G0005 [Candidatus Giovannonibacteria bacterium GW2011_GWF2_42_19]OGF65349.1 MAG: hypothetical protein A2Z53_02445 [Candidatus Giovannonibacteria bacterium RIFCSPHIGHO2_02_42_15]